jgi:hypothetical protein
VSEINPFQNNRICDSVRRVDFTLDSILHKLDLSPEYRKRDNAYEINGIAIGECNFNPYVIIKGVKQYYQRPLVWTLEDKQNLIESIYHGIGCGSIIIKVNSWDLLQQKADAGETELYFSDVIDGKQRLNAIHEFVSNQFCDRAGNYYEQFSKKAQHLFLDHQLFAYGEIDSRRVSSDEDILTQFLMVNFAGVPQSLEHIEYVKSLL